MNYRRDAELASLQLDRNNILRTVATSPPPQYVPESVSKVSNVGDSSTISIFPRQYQTKLLPDFVKVTWQMLGKRVCSALDGFTFSSSTN